MSDVGTPTAGVKRRRMILPTRRLLFLLAIPAAVLLLAPDEITVRLAFSYDAAVLLAVAIDLAISPRGRQIAIERRVAPRLSLDENNSAGWTVSNRSAVPLRLEITEDLPEDFEGEVPSVSGEVTPHGRAEVRYTIRPKLRGRFELGDIIFRYRSVMGLLTCQVRIASRTVIKVYPNVANLARYELAAQRCRLAELGWAVIRRRGDGSSFESLREYVAGDELSDVAWKATARHARLMVRTYELERSQNVLLVVDCGRLMTTKVDRLSRLDYAINASLLLTYVAMKQGDYVGLLAFSDRIDGYVPPCKGRAALGRIQEALYCLQPRLSEPNYDDACQFLALRHRKRSLIIILTDVLDRNASSSLLAHAARFARRHLPLCVTFRNLEVEQLAAQYPSHATDCFVKASAADLLNRRHEALAQMRQSGVDVLDADPRYVAPGLLSRYLEVKRRRL